MKNSIIKFATVIALIATSGLTSYSLNAQTVFFKSSQDYKATDLDVFYSSFAFQGDRVVFNANDYQLYSYHTTTGELIWSYRRGTKSNTPPFVVGESIYTSLQDNSSIEIDANSGELKRELFFTSIETQPFIKDGILYTTGLRDIGGAIIAFDLNADSVLWEGYIAHGTIKKPYYLANKMVVNVDGNYWVDIKYNRRLVNNKCDNLDYVFVNIACEKNNYGLTHDEEEVNDELMSRILGKKNYNPEEVQLFYTNKNTFILCDESLIILGNKLKVIQSLDLNDMLDQESSAYYEPYKLVKFNETSVWIFDYKNLIEIDYKSKKVLNTINLESYNPHQLEFDENNQLWLISKNDGLLYGLKITK